jgi:hypothetical protein
MEHIADRQGGGGWQMRQQVSDADLRAFFEAAKSAADTAQIPAEPEDFDPSDEIKKLIDEAMAAE